MKTSGLFSRRTLSRSVAVGLALLLGLLYSALARGPIGAASHAEAVIAAAEGGLCAAADANAPSSHGRICCTDCVLSCASAWTIDPSHGRAGVAPRFFARGRAPSDGRHLRLAHMASGWRSSWSAQAPPLSS